MRLLLSILVLLFPLCLSFRIGKGAHKFKNFEKAIEDEMKEVYQQQQPQQPQQQQQKLMSGCDWCLAVEPLIEQRVKSHHHQPRHYPGYHGHNGQHESHHEQNGGQKTEVQVEGKETPHKSREERFRSRICEPFGQDPACHDFLSVYGRTIARKVVNGEKNVCQGLMDTRDITGQKGLCSADAKDVWQGVNQQNSAEFDLFLSLMKEMANLVPEKTDVIQRVELVQDNSGQLWQKTETLLSNSQSGDWVDVVKIEPVSGETQSELQMPQGQESLQENHQEVSQHRCKFFEKIKHTFRKHASLIIGLFLLCVFSCVLSKVAKRVMSSATADENNEKAASKAGNVVLNISMMPPAREKNILRPI